jgi:proline iminopeptidase
MPAAIRPTSDPSARQTVLANVTELPRAVRDLSACDHSVRVTVRQGRFPFRGFETWYRVSVPADEGGTPLLALHGGPGSTHLALKVLDALANERAVVLYDQHGSVNSPGPIDLANMTVGAFVEEVDAVRHELGLERVHLLGHSWGGMLALEYALTAPSGLESLVLSSTLPSVGLWAEEAQRLRGELLSETREVLERHEREGTTEDPAYKEAAQEFYRRHLCRLDPWPPVMEEILSSTNLEIYNAMWGPSEMYPTGVLADWNVTPRLGEVRVPTLVLCGRHDEATPKMAEVIAAGVPGAELVVFEASSHTAPIEEPEHYVAVVREFLSRVDKAHVKKGSG